MGILDMPLRKNTRHDCATDPIEFVSRDDAYAVLEDHGGHDLHRCRPLLAAHAYVSDGVSEAD